jgi:hypothetical protein
MMLFHLVAQLAERVGFEPTDLSVNGFQDRRNRPLCHLSARDCTATPDAAGLHQARPASGLASVDPVEADIRPEHVRYVDRAILALVGFQDRGDRAGEGES